MLLPLCLALRDYGATFSLRENGDKGITLPLVHPKMCRIVYVCLHAFSFGGKGIRTPDFQLAKLALYQLSYAPSVNCRV